MLCCRDNVARRWPRDAHKTQVADQRGLVGRVGRRGHFSRRGVGGRGRPGGIVDAREKGRAHPAADVHHDDHDAGHHDDGHLRGGRRGRGQSPGAGGPAAPRTVGVPGQVEPAADRPARRLLGVVQLRAGPSVVPVRRVNHVHHTR